MLQLLRADHHTSKICWSSFCTVLVNGFIVLSWVWNIAVVLDLITTAQFVNYLCRIITTEGILYLVWTRLKAAWPKGDVVSTSHIPTHILDKLTGRCVLIQVYWVSCTGGSIRTSRVWMRRSCWKSKAQTAASSWDTVAVTMATSHSVSGTTLYTM